VARVCARLEITYRLHAYGYIFSQARINTYAPTGNAPHA